MNDQMDLHLPRRDTDSCLRDRLADLVEEFNAETEPTQRVLLYGRIQSLRNRLRNGLPATNFNERETR